MYINFYLNELGFNKMPDFLIKYLKTPSLLRLKKISYFCGMDYASKDIYNFREKITRYDHSLCVCLLTYKLTKDITSSLAGLFHDISTPCFSHVIDYMNDDYEKQESTEEYTEYILKSDKYLLDCLKEDNIDIMDIIDFKKYSIVDNDRPKVCADRIDGVILTGIAWTKNISLNDIKSIVNDMCIFKNEDNLDEIGFKTESIAKKVINVSKTIDMYCHSSEDNYMMQLLAKITKYSINKEYISYLDLYFYDEEYMFNKFRSINDDILLNLLYEFENKKKKDIPVVELNRLKIRDLKPLLNGKRMN